MMEIIMKQNKSKHFNHKSDPMMACPCCEKGTLSVSILMVVEDVRQHFGKPVVITSGSRCRKHQMDINPDAPRSRHIVDKENNWESDAVDFRVIGVHERKVVAYLKKRPYAHLMGIGVYKGRTHADARGSAARW